MKHTTILLVDDDDDDQLIFKEAIKETFSGVQCIVANNGKEAFDHLERSPVPPTIIFLDLNMPVMSGYEFLIRIKRSSLFGHIPIVIYTTSDSPIDKRLCLDEGAHFFFTKTSDFKLLKGKLTEILLG